MKSLPSEDLLPGHFIVLVVYRDDVVHILLFNVTLVPMPPDRRLIECVFWVTTQGGSYNTIQYENRLDQTYRYRWRLV